ncbi:MAG: glycosyltransferase [Bacteroidales bacterium]|nr:glycosyltransferase [Bacteroidales bacterium]
MKLSVIIVNYNVKYFLEQCLYSVQKAIKNIDGEIIVVDNNSVDGSSNMMKEKFSEIKLIQNTKNKGFSVANNQGIKISKAEYILLLNPDTVVEEDTFEKILNFADNNPQTGGLGVKMIDGKGNFLPESKRGLPTPMVAFFKIFGFSKIFSKSKLFNKYHLGYLDKDKIHEIDVLAGAFMLLRRETLDKVGLLDEDYFMYGEDIDLSYRITKAGYKNFYYPETTIIHYKGESTKKGSINYVLLFYNAMIIFAKKHFSKKNAKLYSVFIKIAIYFRAFLSLFSRFVKTFFLPILDALIIYFWYYFFTPVWGNYKFQDTGQYPDEYLFYVVPAYILIWLISCLMIGGYDKPVSIKNMAKGILIGSFIILIIYALLPEELRFSRALILIGTVWVFTSTFIIRLILNFCGIINLKLGKIKKKRIVIVGLQKENERVYSILKSTNILHDFIGFVSPENKIVNKNFIGIIDQLKEITQVNKVEEIIFCAKDIPSQKIIKNMLKLSDIKVNYKIAPPESLSIIGSNSINTAGDLYIVNLNSISDYKNIRKKRLLDIILSVLFLIFYPVLIFIVNNPALYIKNIFIVCFGFKTWVGYYIENNVNIINLPVIKKGILNTVDLYNKKELSDKTAERINIIYAKDYKIINDLSIIYKGFKFLGRK